MKRPRILEEGTTQAKVVKRRYTREAKIWSSLDHVNVLSFYGVVEISSVAYLVAPWVAHGDLSKFLTRRLEYLAGSSSNQGSFSDRKCSAFSTFDEATVIHGIASGLAYLHASGVIHGDIKAANVLLDDALNPLLADFGLTKNEEFDATSPGLAGGGTARWKSPGLTEEQPRTTKTDIYALGMTIVEILTGREPFPHLRSSFKVCRAITQGHRPPVEPLSRNGKDFRPLWEVAAACWQKEPENRPTAVGIVSRTSDFLPMHSPYHASIEIDIDISSDPQPGIFEQPNGRFTTFHEQQLGPLLPNGSYNHTKRNPDDLTGVTSGSLSGSSIGEQHNYIACSAGSISQQNTDTDTNTNTDIDTGINIDTDTDTDTETDTDDDTENGCSKDGRQGYHDERCASLSEAAAIYEGLGDQERKADCLRSIGEIKETLGRYEDAYTSLNDAIEIYKRLGDQRMMAECLKSIGKIEETQGHYDDAYASLSEATTIYKQLDDQDMAEDCLTAVARIANIQAQYADPCASLIEEAAIYKLLDDQNMAAGCLESVGKVRGAQGRYDDACASLSEAAMVYEQLGNQDTAADCLKSVAQIKESQVQHDDPCVSLIEEAAIYKLLDDQTMAAECLKSVGEIRRSQGRYDDACASLSEAAAIYKQFNNRMMTVDCFKTIAKIEEHQGHYDDAFTSLKDAWTNAKDLGDQRLNSTNAKAFEVLLGLWCRSIDMVSKSTDPELIEIRDMVDSLCRTAKVRYEKQLYDEVVDLFDDVRRLLKGLEDGWGPVECLRSLGAIYRKQGNRLGHIKCLVRLATALGPIDVPESDEHEPSEGYLVVMKAGQVLGSMRHLVWVPERLKIEVAKLHVHLAIAFHTRLRRREAHSALLEASQFPQQPDEQLQAKESLLRLEDVLRCAGYIYEAITVSQERTRAQPELGTDMLSTEAINAGRRLMCFWWA